MLVPRLNNFMDVVETACIPKREGEEMRRIRDKGKKRDVIEAPRRGDFVRAENRRRTEPRPRALTTTCGR